jgi:acyl-CoA thioester hydrolase
MFYRFCAEVPLRWVDVDAVGVVNNAVYLSLLEQARYLYFEHLGLLSGPMLPFLLAETNVKFVRPGKLGMKVEVAAATTRLGNRSFAMQYEVRGDEQVLVTATAALVFVDAQHQPCAIPEAWRQAMAEFDAPAAG